MEKVFMLICIYSEWGYFEERKEVKSGKWISVLTHKHGNIQLCDELWNLDVEESWNIVQNVELQK